MNFEPRRLDDFFHKRAVDVRIRAARLARPYSVLATAV